MTKALPFILILSTLAYATEFHIAAPSFPEISSYFNISDGTTQLTISVNLIGYCIACVFVGPLSETYGRRPIMIIGGAIMLIGAVGCVFAPTIEFLLFSRFIQGIGASTPAVIVFAIIADLYSGTKAVKLIGQMTALLTICSSVAPVVGGFIHQMLGWRGNYGFVAILSFVSLISVIAKLPETKTSFDDLNIGQIAHNYWTILTNERFVYAACVPVLCYTGFIGFIVSASFLYIKTFNLPMMHYVLHQGIIILSFSVSSMFVGSFIKLVGEQKSAVWGAKICLAATSLMVLLALFADNSIYTAYTTTALMMVFVIGCASCRAVMLAKAMEIYPQFKGQASAVISGLRMLISAIFVTINSYFYDGSLFVVAMSVFLTSLLMLLLNLRFLNKSSVS